MWMRGQQLPPIILADGNAVEKCVIGLPCPLTVWVNMTAEDIALGTQVTVSYSKDNGVEYTTLAVVTASGWEVQFKSGITHLKLQRTAGTGTTSTCGAC